MLDWIQSGLSFLQNNEEHLKSALRLALMVLLGLPLVFWLARRVKKRVSVRFSSQQGMLASRLINYSGVILVGLAVLRELGFPLTHLLGAAGIFGIALGFASQTSVSNIISGVFLMAEKPFIVGDLISVGTLTGQILSIDTLSIKLRTLDNKMVRIPNETIVKTEVTNITRFPIRRIDLNIGVAYKEDTARVREVLYDIAFRNPRCLQHPEPLVVLTGFGSSSVDMLFAVWVLRADWMRIKNELLEQVKQRFDAEGIEIPFPHLSLYKGATTEPIPIQLVGANSLPDHEEIAPDVS